uniref:Glutathione synthetase n=1 Tax=Parastrongyloides trichosuri TaxID=131310 RepID=A0A0N4Z651_PARTI
MNLYSQFIKLIKEDPKLLITTIDDAKDYAVVHGNVLRLKTSKNKSDIVQHAPFMLLPSPFPKILFVQACNVQILMNKLYYRISFDRHFLIDTLKHVIEGDEFTRKLFNIYNSIMEEGINQPISLLLQRADYFCHVNSKSGEYELKQIEVNNIAAGMASLSEITSGMHRYLLRNLKMNYCDDDLPLNESRKLLGKGIGEAWKMYNKKDSYVLHLIENVNQNQLDFRHIQYATDLYTNYECKTIRIPLSECKDRLKLGIDKELIMDNKYEIGVVYFRTGYSPENYLNEDHWRSRLLIERSKAIKSPWIGLQLANTKKVQQVLLNDGVLERFLDNHEECNRVRDVFAKMWAFDDERMIKEMKIKIKNNPELYVLKEQLEGGLGNYFDEEMIKKINESDVTTIKTFVLMEKLNPLRSRNFIIISGKDVEECDVVSELGVMVMDTF